MESLLIDGRPVHLLDVDRDFEELLRDYNEDCARVFRKIVEDYEEVIERLENKVEELYEMV